MTGKSSLYLDFELGIGDGGPTRYPVSVICSPAGEASGEFRWPFGETPVETIIASIQAASETSPDGRIHNLGEESSGVPSNFYGQLRIVLLECDPFATDRALNAVFVDSRLSPWQNRLPQADNPTGRVERVVNFLHNQHNDMGENALILLLRVLSERLDPGNACHQRLANLASEFEREVKSCNSARFESAERATQALPQDLDAPSSPDEMMAVGGQLFRALFTGPLRSLLDSSLAEAHRQEKGLYLKFHIDPPELVGLPWEFLYDERTGRFLCLSYPAGVGTRPDINLSQTEAERTVSVIFIRVLDSNSTQFTPLSAGESSKLQPPWPGDSPPVGNEAMLPVSAPSTPRARQRLLRLGFGLLLILVVSLFAWKTYLSVSDGSQGKQGTPTATITLTLPGNLPSSHTATIAPSPSPVSIDTVDDDADDDADDDDADDDDDDAND